MKIVHDESKATESRVRAWVGTDGWTMEGKKDGKEVNERRWEEGR